MRVSRLTYPIIAIAIIPVALVSLKKINKISFFDHFFKVIEEVEMRNSHELEAPDLLWYQASLSTKSEAQEPAKKLPSTFLLSFVPVKGICFTTASLTVFSRIIRGMQLGHLLPFCRAP